jgi:hypothetical protein
MSFPCPLFVVFIPQKAEKPPTREGGFSYPFIIYFYGVNAIPGAEWKPLMNFTHLSRVSKEALIKSLSDFILVFLFNARNKSTRIASYLRRLIT